MHRVIIVISSLLIVIGAIIGIVVYNKKKNKSQSEKNSDSKTELSEKEKEARQTYQENFFKSSFAEELEKEVESSAVKYQPYEGEFTPENWASWLKKIITEQWKEKLHSNFPKNVSEYEKNASLKNLSAEKFMEVIKIASVPKKENGKIDWIQILAVEKYWESFQKLETYQAVKSYIEKTLNPTLAQNETALLATFS